MSDNTSKIFTINPEKTGVEMPTLSSLLYRKKLAKSEGSTDKSDGSRSALPRAIEPTHVSLIPQEGEDQSAPVVLKSSFVPPENTPSGAGPLSTKVLKSEWTPEASKSIQFKGAEALSAPSASEVEKGILAVQSRSKFFGALILEPEDEKSVSYFASRGVQLSDRSAITSGIRIDQKEFSDLWGRIAKFGFVEFAPLGVSAQGNFDRNAFRGAFGTQSNEWVTLVRWGTPETVQGVVAFYTEGSIQAHLPQFHTASQGSQKKAA